MQSKMVALLLIMQNRRIPWQQRIFSGTKHLFIRQFQTRWKWLHAGSCTYRPHLRIKAMKICKAPRTQNFSSKLANSGRII